MNRKLGLEPQIVPRGTIWTEEAGKLESKSTFGPQQEMCLEGLSLSKLFHVEQFWVADQNRRAGLGVRNVPRGTFLSGRRVEIVPRGTIWR
jgi:hypothetical protein